jgi:outer membrane protein OmpA-like peptidoglycan-associated protein
MPGFVITSYQESEFDSADFPVTEAGKEKKQHVEGRKFEFRYDRSASSQASALQVIRNHQNAARAAGGQVLMENGDGGDRATTFRISKGASEVWAWVHCIGNGTVYSLIVVEKQAMNQDITVDAKAMGDGLTATGHVEVPGIFFDTAKSVLKPESDAALKEIAKLLQANPALKVWVVGHTDAVGSPESNMALSNARAAAVIQALTQKNGIDAKRLAAFGNGPYAPVASNDSEEGRAKNRRVDLVKHL